MGSLNMASGFLIPTLQRLIASEVVSHRCKFKFSVSHYVNTEDLILSKKWKVAVVGGGGGTKVVEKGF